ncbi:hypothetical protein D12LOC_04226 [Dickeya solani]|nr:hypothetical protein [Dickeya solani]
MPSVPSSAPPLSSDAALSSRFFPCHCPRLFTDPACTCQSPLLSRRPSAPTRSPPPSVSTPPCSASSVPRLSRLSPVSSRVRLSSRPALVMSPAASDSAPLAASVP